MNCVMHKKQKGESKMNCVMQKKQKGESKMKRAFTLIELMIVMVVIAILAGIALPRLKGMRDEGNITKATGELRTLKTAMESYAMHHSDTYPASSTTPYDTYLDAGGVGTGPQLIHSVLNDPFDSSNEYYYILGTDTDYYAFCSKGLDGIADVVSSEVDGTLTSVEVNDDIVASNCTLP